MQELQNLGSFTHEPCKVQTPVIYWQSSLHYYYLLLVQATLFIYFILTKTNKLCLVVSDPAETAVEQNDVMSVVVI